MILQLDKLNSLTNHKKASLLVGAVIVLGLIRSILFSFVYGNGVFLDLKSGIIASAVYVTLGLLAVLIWNENKWARRIILTLFITASAIYALTIITSPTAPILIFALSTVQIYLEIKTAKLLLSERSA